MAETGRAEHPTTFNQGVSHTLSHKTSSCSARRTEFLQNKGIRTNVNYHFANDKPKGFRSCSGLSKLPVDNVSGPEGRRNQPSHFQPEKLERICSHRTIQTHKCFSGTGLSPTKGLALQSRSFTGLFQSVSVPVPQTVFAVNLSGKVATNDVPSVWSQHSAQSVRNTNKLGCANTKTGRHSNNRVPRRFFNCTPGFPNAASPHPASARTSSLFRMADELRKVNHDPLQKLGISGSSLESVVKRTISTTRKNIRSETEGVGLIAQGHHDPKKSPKPCRQTKFCQFCCTQGQTAFSRHADVSKQDSERNTSQHLHSTRGGKRRVEMVASKLSSGLSDSLPTTLTLSDHRRIGRSVGCSARQPLTVGTLDNTRTEPSLQPKRNDRNTENFRAARSALVQVNSSDTVRQQNGCSILTKRGRNQILTLDADNQKGFSPTGPPPNPSKNPIYSGQIQQPCRSPFTSSASPRMASTPSVHNKSFQKVRSTNDRPIRIGTSKGCNQLCVTGPERYSRHVSRCLFPNLELPPSLGVSTALLDPQGSTTPQLGVRRVSLSSSEVGESVLETGSKSPCISASVHDPETSFAPERHSNRPPTPQGSRHDNGSMEMWGWSENLTEWTESQLRLLKDSWRPSTKKTYKVAWNRWLKWTKGHKLNPLQPTGSILSRFLADLYIVDGLAYSTILLHKSVVSTLCNCDNDKLGSHVLVRHILKAIALKKPVPRKSTVWNIDKLTLFLSSYSVDENSIFATCRHTATLLLLCSGRRVHDLTLLAVDSKHLSENNDCLILWPMFGSKTDTATYRQSGWRLSSNFTNKKLDPVFWVKRTISLLEVKRQSGCQNLFINIRGQPRAASRTVIAGWVKSLLSEAGVVDSAGSIRSAVASKNWSDNCPLDEILARGNWRSHNTFARFYCKEVIPTNTNVVTSLFNSI